MCSTYHRLSQNETSTPVVPVSRMLRKVFLVFIFLVRQSLKQMLAIDHQFMMDISVSETGEQG